MDSLEVAKYIINNKKGAWAKVYQDGEKNIIPDEYIKQEADEYNIFAI